MGAADVVPGVSGGTIAFITGIYEILLDSIKKVDLEALNYLKYCQTRTMKLVRLTNKRRQDKSSNKAPKTMAPRPIKRIWPSLSWSNCVNMSRQRVGAKNGISPST